MCYKRCQGVEMNCPKKGGTTLFYNRDLRGGDVRNS